MYGKLEDNTLKYAPHYVIYNNKIILNPQSEDYLIAGYKEIEFSADKRNPEDPLLVWEAIENATPGIPYVKELRRNDFQHRF